MFEILYPIRRQVLKSYYRLARRRPLRRTAIDHRHVTGQLGGYVITPPTVVKTCKPLRTLLQCVLLVLLVSEKPTGVSLKLHRRGETHRGDDDGR